MTFIRVVIPAALALLCAGAAAAQTASFVTFKAGMTPQQAMDAAPQVSWEKSYNSRGDELWWTSADDAVSFGGALWDVQAGSARGQGGVQLTEGYVEIERKLAAKRSDVCAPLLGAMVAELEPVLGAFGADPDFAKARSDRYNPDGDRYKFSKVGQFSTIRDAGQFGAIRRWDTFREPQGDRVRVAASVEWDSYEKACHLQVAQWLVSEKGF
jgi:hypothetical protein